MNIHQGFTLTEQQWLHIRRTLSWLLTGDWLTEDEKVSVSRMLFQLAVGYTDD